MASTPQPTPQYGQVVRTADDVSGWGAVMARSWGGCLEALGFSKSRAGAPHLSRTGEVESAKPTG
ncbi:hypothetical protein GCM10007888_14330 [Methylobacterium oxalidis]|uniref:Uncharacterized protein n=1 Tax=Methylobacterium oxalidis TaxID=944322 RepID=A0ABQ6DH13_9HYPH|nr:hypothetical protein GCM10007888_14330 [Methylobacterium oxalidis]